MTNQSTMSTAQPRIKYQLDYMENRRKEPGTKRGRTRKISLLEKEKSSLVEEMLRKI